MILQHDQGICENQSLTSSSGSTSPAMSTILMEDKMADVARRPIREKSYSANSLPSNRLSSLAMRQRVFEEAAKLSEEKSKIVKESILFVVGFLHSSIESATLRSSPLPPLLTVLCMLQFYASGCHYIIIADRHGVSKSSVCRAIKKGTLALCEHVRQWVKWPQTADTNTIKRQFFNIAGFPNVIGAIDCTHVRISGPRQNEPAYINRKGFHSINVQMVCDATFRITNVVAKWPGSVHDSRIFRDSALATKLENGAIDGLLLGDSGYPCRKYLLTPYLHPNVGAQQRYNDSLTKTRVVIEQTFGMIKKRFPCLSYGLRIEPELATSITTACVILHNLGIERGDTLCRVTDITLEEPEYVVGDQHNGAAYRDVFANTYFQ